MSFDRATVETIVSGLENPETRLFATLRPKVGSAPTLIDPDTDGSELGLPRISISLADTGRAKEGEDVLGLVRETPPREFVVRRLLGEGGMGRVMLGAQRSIGRDVAIKIAQGPAHDVALATEGRITGQLEHPNVVPVHALGRDPEGRPVVVMKKIDGAPLSLLLEVPEHPLWKHVESGSSDRLEAKLRTLAQVANALSFAHSRGIVHRDLKPENVMLGSFGEVYLVDWGIACPLGSRPSLAGTPVYMAPESLLGQPVTERTDVFLLGATLHELLTGKPRHAGQTVVDVLFAAGTCRPFAYGDSVPEELAALANEATSIDPAQRPATALAFRERLLSFLTHRASHQVSAGAAERIAAAKAERVDEARALDVARHLAAARFGFREALKIWADNERAQRGLAETLELSIEHELDARNPRSARLYLDELAGVDDVAPFRERIEQLERDQAAERQRLVEADARARDLDAGVGARRRLLLIAALLPIGIALSTYGLYREVVVRQPITMTELVQMDTLILVALGAYLFAARRAVTANRWNVSMWFLIGLPMVLAAFFDVVGTLRGWEPTVACFVDTMLAFTSLVAGSVTLHRPLVWAAVPQLTAALLVALFPSVGLAVASSATVLSLAIVALETQRVAQTRTTRMMR